ncbi:MAG: T9SS type A sorting domain-containing protein [Ignavibacteria bacterium]|jgi:hypothetical protein
MKTLIYFFLILFLNTTCTFPQTTFSDGFETGDFSKWDNNVGATISNAYHHTGNYSAKFCGLFSVTNKIVKNNIQTSYMKIDFYVYATDFGEYYSYLQFGGNGLVWYYAITGHSQGDIYNCTHSLVNSPTIYFPLNYWNHVTIERISTGFLYVWINGVQCVDGATVGSCPYTDIAIQGISGSSVWGKMTSYIDDIIINYSSVGITPISSEVPNKYKLSQNYPNPFNPTTNIKFDIPKTSLVKMTIYDALGREIEILVNEKLKEGSYQVDWNASKYPSGVYFYKLEIADLSVRAEKFSDVKKMILLK